jgi:NADH-quinone oxidoreductase subunit N
VEVASNEQLNSIAQSFTYFAPELIYAVGIVVILLAMLIWRQANRLHLLLSFLTISVSAIMIFVQWPSQASYLFGSMIRKDGFSAYLQIIIDVSGWLTLVMMSRHSKSLRAGEFYILLLSMILGAHLLTMSTNFAIAFIAFELISICSYLLTGFSFDRRSSEGSLKYFVFGSVASAVMLYGLTFLYGFTGTLDFTSDLFAKSLVQVQSPLLLVSIFMILAGFLYKMAAAPLHPWVPDVYEAAPMPVIAFFSVSPKVAALAILTRFILIVNRCIPQAFDWQWLLASIAILTLLFGNFSALWQKNVKRLMAYSSIGQTGFLLTAVVALLPQGIQAVLFFATIYTLSNYLVFIYLQHFHFYGFESIADFKGIGKTAAIPSFALLIGMIALTGLPPTAGFTGKLFVFSALWESFELTGKQALLWLMIFGLLNTVISLFYYLRIPYMAYIKEGSSDIPRNILTSENLLGIILVLAILTLFFIPGMLMGWINKINFVF